MITLKCLVCDSNLTGKRIKFCSYKCEAKYAVERNKAHRHKQKALRPKKLCLVCQIPIPEGTKRTTCSIECKNKHRLRPEAGIKNYIIQRKRAKERKLILINMLGGSCQSCGYCKNYSVLSFHHVDPKLKKFGIDSRQCSNRSWKALFEEVAKCILLCLNCHSELHHPACLMGADGNDPST